MERIKNKFRELKEINKKALVAFISACDPNLKFSQEILNKLPSYGADIIEIGLPFSDPMADGPTIQKSSQRAIKSGFTVDKTLNLIKNFRKLNKKTPIIFMGYFNTIYQYGLKNFFQKSSNFGVDGVIIVDLPPEEEFLIDDFIRSTNINIIKLITPTTSKERLKTILKSAGGFLYYVSIMGITGTKKPSMKDVKNAVELIQKNTSMPIVVGFGINNVMQISKISKFADGSVVGSSLVKIIEKSVENKQKNEKTLSNIKKFIQELNHGCYTN